MPLLSLSCAEWDAMNESSSNKRGELSMYIMYWGGLALFEALQSYDSDMKPYVQSHQVAELSMLLDKMSNVAYSELTRQLAFHYAGDNAKFDVIQVLSCAPPQNTLLNISKICKPGNP